MMNKIKKIPSMRKMELFSFPQVKLSGRFNYEVNFKKRAE